MLIDANRTEVLEPEQEQTLFAELDKGIDDMENGRTSSHRDAMKKIREAVNSYVI